VDEFQPLPSNMRPCINATAALAVVSQVGKRKQILKPFNPQLNFKR
jgi:hypothetical protein